MTRNPLLRFGLLALGLVLAAPASAGFLNGVSSRDGVDVMAVGDSGMVFRSVDGGFNFAKSYQGSTPLRSVAMNAGTILIVGDQGKIVRSADNGMTWSTSTATGSPHLYGVEMPTASTAFVVGAGGTLLKSTNGGVSWTPLSPGTSATLRSVRFTDASNGWIVGDNGFIKSTSNGGTSWNPTPLTTPNHLYTIDRNGSRVWAAGANSTCWKSTNGGASWSAVDLKIDSRSDVRGVVLQGADSVCISGGGGFVRRSLDNGATWTFPQHALFGEVSDMYWVGARGFITSIRSPSVMRSWDHGASWFFPTGTVISRSWVQKQTLQEGTTRGSAIALNPQNRSTIYAGLGKRLYVSRDDGETWTQIGTIPGTKINAMLMSPKDSLKITLTSSPPQQILYSEDGGSTWDTATNGVHAFGEYGIPLEMHPDKPDTLFFGADNSLLYRSTDFGKSWDTYGSKTFRSPCDLIVVPESDSSVVLVGDGITSSGLCDLWRSVDGAQNFTKMYTGPTNGSEIPGMSISRLANQRVFATNWAVGGLLRSTNGGLTWPQEETTTAAWGVDVCKEDPNVVVYGVYSGAIGYVSTDGGANYTGYTLPSSNYSFYARDRACILAEQGLGIYKLTSTYAYGGQSTQNAILTAPNGGEVWAAGSVHDIVWTTTNMPMVRIEYRPSSEDPWQTLADVPGYYGRWSWTLPYVATTEAEIRVSDAIDASPSDVSSVPFTIGLPTIAADPNLDFGLHSVGFSAVDSVEISNTGTATLHVTSVASGNPAFTAPSSGFDVPVGGSRFVRVTFTASAATSYATMLTVNSDGWNAPSLQVPLAGTGQDGPTLRLESPDGGEELPYGATHTVRWTAELVGNIDLHFRTSPYQAWVTLLSNQPSTGGSWNWLIPDAPTTVGELRIREAGGNGLEGTSAPLSILVPRFATTPYDIKEMGPVLLSQSRVDTVRVCNTGTAPMVVTDITVDRPTFWPVRTSFTLQPGECDTLSFVYDPQNSQRDTAEATFFVNDPTSPHTLLLTGFGTNTTAVGGSDPSLPVGFALGQNQPNPFHGATTIAYALPHAAAVSLEVFNLQGQRVATLVDGEQAAGSYRHRFAARRPDGSVLPSGVYFYRFRAGTFSATRKMLLMQ